MRNFIYSLMTDKRNGFFYDICKFKLYVLSLVYGLAILSRRLLYRARIFKARKAPLKVISVGNLTLGGTGKTPFTVALGHMLESEFKKNVCVLIRGYGWDEQAMLKDKLSDIPVLVGKDRARSALKAVKLYGSDTAILDDGFQHWELARDINIVLIDAGNPFGNSNLFPRGILREPKGALARADFIVFTKTDKSGINMKALEDEVRHFNNSAGFLEAVHAPTHLYENKTRQRYDLRHLNGKRVMLLSSIGDPGYFEKTVRDLGADIAEHIVYPDHHDYRKGDMDHVLRRCGERSFELVLTTEKDMVKLSRLGLYLRSYKVLALAIEMKITSGKELLIAGLDRLYIH